MLYKMFKKHRKARKISRVTGTRRNKQKTNNKMTDLNASISVITLNVHGLNTSVKDRDWKSGLQNPT